MYISTLKDSDVVGRTRYVGTKRRPRQDGGIVADKATNEEKEGVEAEEEFVTDLATPLQHLESEPPDEARGIDRNWDVGQSNEAYHDIKKLDITGANDTMVDFLAPNGLYSEQQKVYDQWSSDN